jgi:hypothetical protein
VSPAPQGDLLQDVALKIAEIRNRASQLGLQVQDDLTEGGNALSVKVIGKYGGGGSIVNIGGGLSNSGITNGGGSSSIISSGGGISGMTSDGGSSSIISSVGGMSGITNGGGSSSIISNSDSISGITSGGGSSSSIISSLGSITGITKSGGSSSIISNGDSISGITSGGGISSIINSGGGMSGITNGSSIIISNGGGLSTGAGGSSNIIGGNSIGSIIGTSDSSSNSASWQLKNATMVGSTSQWAIMNNQSSLGSSGQGQNWMHGPGGASWKTKGMAGNQQEGQFFSFNFSSDINEESIVR